MNFKQLYSLDTVYSALYLLFHLMIMPEVDTIIICISLVRKQAQEGHLANKWEKILSSLSQCASLWVIIVCRFYLPLLSFSEGLGRADPQGKRGRHCNYAAGCCFIFDKGVS